MVPVSESLSVGQLADWVVAARSKGGAPAYTPLDASVQAALRGSLPSCEAGRIDTRLNACLLEVEVARQRYAKANLEVGGVPAEDTA